MLFYYVLVLLKTHARGWTDAEWDCIHSYWSTVYCKSTGTKLTQHHYQTECLQCSSSTNAFSSEAMTVEEAVVILRRFPGLATGVGHALHLTVPPVDILQRSDAYKCHEWIMANDVTFHANTKPGQSDQTPQLCNSDVWRTGAGFKTRHGLWPATGCGGGRCMRLSV